MPKNVPAVITKPIEIHAKPKPAYQVKVSELIPDNNNFNKGNEFGEGLIEKSFRNFGAGRSILLDKNNRIIAGNKSTQKFVETGGEDVIIVETTGNQIVAVKRNDIDLDSPEGREMALADNATAKANIDWDEVAISKAFTVDQQSEWGIDLSFEPESEESETGGEPAGFELKLLFEHEQDREGFKKLIIPMLMKVVGATVKE